MRLWIIGFVVVAGCGSVSVETTTSTSDGLVPPTTIRSESPAAVPPQLESLDVATFQLDDRSLLLAIADTPQSRSSGLMFVADLDDLDGMLFSWRADTDGSFWMRDTLIPLDIAFFDADGRFVSKTTMTPCGTDECPRYGAGRPYRHAIEVAAGAFGWVGAGSQLDLSILAD